MSAEKGGINVRRGNCPRDYVPGGICDVSEEYVLGKLCPGNHHHHHHHQHHHLIFKAHEMSK